MIQRIKCWLANNKFKDKHKWHKWKIIAEGVSEYNPEVITGVAMCSCCGETAFFAKENRGYKSHSKKCKIVIKKGKEK